MHVHSRENITSCLFILYYSETSCVFILYEGEMSHGYLVLVGGEVVLACQLEAVVAGEDPRALQRPQLPHQHRHLPLRQLLQLLTHHRLCGLYLLHLATGKGSGEHEIPSPQEREIHSPQEREIHSPQ